MKTHVRKNESDVTLIFKKNMTLLFAKQSDFTVILKSQDYT